LKIQVWSPAVDPRAGGIENYSSAIVRALADVYGAETVSVLAKHQSPDELRARVPPGVRVFGTGAVPSRLRTAAFSSLLLSRRALDRPDLILSTHLNFATFAIMAPGLFRTKYAISLHGIEAWELRRRSQATALQHADLLLPVSGFTRDIVASAQRLPSARFQILPNTVDTEQFTIGPKPGYLLERYGLGAAQPTILSVGRLFASEQYKGHDRVIRALGEVRQEVPDVRYLIVGDGDDRPRLQALCETEGVAGLVIFAGRVPATELADHYRLCDLFALPSNGEGFGIVFLEALACGKPVIAGSRDGARETLVDGELGVCVDPDDIDALAKVMGAILTRSHPHPLLNRPEALRAAVVERYGFPQFKASLASYLDDLLRR
jgi:glycosyltransferase involved in cell wall biosynthesis